MRPNAYTTMQRARELRERHPDASPSLVAVALAAASFADGPTGTSIRPSHARIAEITGLSVARVNKLMQRLVRIEELRRDKPAWRGSAACYTWVGGMVVADVPPLDVMVVSGDPNGGAPATTHQSYPSDPSGLPGPRGARAGKRCRKHREVELYEGRCVRCEEEEYYRVHGGPVCTGCGEPLGHSVRSFDDALCPKCSGG